MQLVSLVTLQAVDAVTATAPPLVMSWLVLTT